MRPHSADKPVCAYKSLCDSQADAAATGLFEALDRCASRGVMLGHQDDLSYGVGWVDAGDGRSDVRDVTGDYPSLFGWDLGHLELDSLRNLDGVPFEAMRRNMLSVDRMGGVNAPLSWHPRNPLTGGDAWDVTSAEVVSSIISGGALHDRYMAWIDRLADFVLSLRRDDGSLAPVIFRPYHEMSGSWFWWGAELCSDDDYKVLWRETIDRLRSRGVHNIVVAYSMADYADERQFAARYPGDDYVDIVGFDIYQYGSADEFLSQMKTKSGIARAFADKHDKLWAICECGYEGHPAERLVYGRAGRVCLLDRMQPPAAVAQCPRPRGALLCELPRPRLGRGHAPFRLARRRAYALRLQTHCTIRRKMISSILTEIPPVSREECFAVFERHKTSFNFPIHVHSLFELNYIENAAGAERIVGDHTSEIDDLELVLITGPTLEHAWVNHNCRSNDIYEITIQMSADLFGAACSARSSSALSPGCSNAPRTA